MVTSAHAGSPVRSMLRHLFGSGLAGIVLAPALAAAFAGTPAVLSALVGAVLVTVVMLLGFAGITAVTNGPSALSLAGAALVFTGQLVLVVAAIAVLRDAPWVHGRALTIAAASQVLVLQAGQVLGYLRGRHVLMPQPPRGSR